VPPPPFALARALLARAAAAAGAPPRGAPPRGALTVARFGALARGALATLNLLLASPPFAVALGRAAEAVEAGSGRGAGASLGGGGAPAALTDARVATLEDPWAHVHGHTHALLRELQPHVSALWVTTGSDGARSLLPTENVITFTPGRTPARAAAVEALGVEAGAFAPQRRASDIVTLPSCMLSAEGAAMLLVRASRAAAASASAAASGAGAPLAPPSAALLGAAPDVPLYVPSH
jgi:hypothetical protein